MGGEVACDAVAFSDDSQRIATGLQDGTLELRSSKDGGVLKRFPGPPGGCERVAFAAGGRTLLAWGGGTCRVWDVEGGTLAGSFPVPVLHCWATTPDGRHLLVGGDGAPRRR